MRLPTNQQRILILGRTGSGKSRAAVWHLSQKDITQDTWIVLNHKHEEFIDSIPGAEFINLNYTPKKPGIYVYHPVPELDDEAVTNLLWRVHGRGDIGVYIDEGYMIGPRDPALVALLTQGRSKNIPMIILSQRPSQICRFAISEADFYQLYHLTDKRDRERVNAFIPINLEIFMRSEMGEKIKLPPYHSIYYDIAKNNALLLRPVPGDTEILGAFESQLISKNNKKYFI